MNFEKWYEEFSIKTNGGYSSSDYKYITEESWDACKKEVLKVLKKNKCQPLNFGSDDMDTREDEYIEIDAIKEIEKL